MDYQDEEQGGGFTKKKNAMDYQEEDGPEIDEYLDEEMIEQFLKQQEKDQINEINYTEADYCRPTIREELNDTSKDFFFMQIDVDYYNTRDQVTNQERSVIRLYGVNEYGNSILVHVHNFQSYLYVECPLGFDTSKANLEGLRLQLCQTAQTSRNFKGQSEAVTKIEPVEKESIRHYKGPGKSVRPFLKIFTSVPGVVGSLRGKFEQCYNYKDRTFPGQTFESNMPYALRYMIDTQMAGMSWVQLQGSTYTIRDKEKRCISRCQLEIDVDYKDVIPLKPEGEWGKIAPLRIFSFDIECSAYKKFPEADKDPVIQIASICKNHNENTHFLKTIYTLNSCSNIVDSEVRSFQKEADLLKAFERLIQVCDPDIITGYNIINFDFPYIINRAKALKIKNYGYLGRMITSISKLKDGKYLSKAMGMRDTKELSMEGRIQFDMLQQMHRDQKLSSYSLNSVSYQFLKEQKEDVPHNCIYDLQNGNADTRRRIATYCLKDAYLPLKLLEKLMCLYNQTEMARVTGVPINYLFNRGQQIKVASQLYRKAAQVNMIIPAERSKGTQDQYEGAIVIKPEVNHYTVPIATLDFASLYPSIMMAHNLCYSTLISPELARKMNPDDFIETPKIKKYFVKDSVRKGLLPQILDELLQARKKAKKELAEATDPFVKAVLDGRQLALKISANSVYGFTGAMVGQLPCIDIANSVTAFGQEMITKTKETVEEIYCKKNGFKFDAKVIYGDTDSVMVKFGVDSVAEAMALGKEAALEISKKFKAPIKLEFEKVYYPYLLLNRKRYAGLLWTKPEKYDKIDTKGIEAVRRDNCALIRMMMNECLNMVLIQRDVPKSIDYVKSIISDLLQNKIDLSMLIITKQLTKKSEEQVLAEQAEEDKKKQNYQQQYQQNRQQDNKKQDTKNMYKAKQAHVELAERMKIRDPGTAPSIGDRIQYVMIKGASGSKNYENAEDPVFALTENLKIDFDYYIEKQIKPPLQRLFEHIIPNTNSLFQGEHTKQQFVQKVATKGMMGSFIKVVQNCMGCKTPLQDQNQALCSRCKLDENKERNIYIDKVLELNTLQQSFAALWTQCQSCQGNLHQEILCTNRDCPIFFKRTKIQMDIENAQKNLDRFDNSW